MKRVPTRTAEAPAASAAATARALADAAGGDDRQLDRVEHRVEQRQQPELAVRVPAGLDALGDDEVAARGLGGERLLARSVTCQDASAPPRVDRLDELRVRVAEEHVDQRGLARRPARGTRGRA